MRTDALDALGLPGAVTALTPMWSANRLVTGRVRTVKAGPKAADGPATHIASPLVAVAEPGDVIVIDNDGRTGVSCWGGLLAEAAVRNGVVGVIVDGALRDVPDCVALGLPLFARAAVPVSARDRIVQEDMDVPVRVADVRVCPGDAVVADRSGVVFVPAAQLPAVLDLAERIAAREQAMVEAVRGGRSIVDVATGRERVRSTRPDGSCTGRGASRLPVLAMGTVRRTAPGAAGGSAVSPASRFARGSRRLGPAGQ